jgi:hypothetical protein
MIHSIWHLHQLALGQICKGATELDLPTTRGASRLARIFPVKRRNGFARLPSSVSHVHINRPKIYGGQLVASGFIHYVYTK